MKQSSGFVKLFWIFQVLMAGKSESHYLVLTN